MFITYFDKTKHLNKKCFRKLMSFEFYIWKKEKRWRAEIKNTVDL